MKQGEKAYAIEWDTFEPGSFVLCVGPLDRRGVHRFVFSRRAMCNGRWYVQIRIWVWMHRTDLQKGSGGFLKSSTAKRKYRTSTRGRN